MREKYCFLCIQLSVTGASFSYLFVFISTASVVALGCCCCIALLWWTGQDGGWVGIGRTIEGRHDGGLVVEGLPWRWGKSMLHLLCCTLVEETWWKDGKMGGEVEECSTTCCCWTWHTEPASAGGALWWPAAFSTHAAERKQEWDHTSEIGWYKSPCVCTAVISSVSDLLCSPLCVAQCPKLVWVWSTDLMQRGQVSRQVRPKVLCGFREVRDILQTQSGQC